QSVTTSLLNSGHVDSSGGMSDLSAPLIRRRARKQAGGTTRRRHLPIARLTVLGIAFIAATAVATILIVETPDGGRPVAEVAITSTRAANPIAGANALV